MFLFHFLKFPVSDLLLSNILMTDIRINPKIPINLPHHCLLPTKTLNFLQQTLADILPKIRTNNDIFDTFAVSLNLIHTLNLNLIVNLFSLFLAHFLVSILLLFEAVVTDYRKYGWKDCFIVGRMVQKD